MINKNSVFKLLFFLVFLLFSYFLINLVFAPPKIISVSPLSGSIGVSAKPTVVVEFSGPPNVNLLSFNFTPGFVFALQKSGNSVYLSPQKSLEFQTAYNLTVKNRVTQKIIFSSFFTTFAPEGGPQIPQEAESIVKNDYPLYLYRPDNNASFYFSYDGPKKLKVFLKGNKNSAQKEFEDWAKSKGVDLATHQIQYLSPP